MNKLILISLLILSSGCDIQLPCGYEYNSWVEHTPTGIMVRVRAYRSTDMARVMPINGKKFVAYCKDLRIK